MNTIGHYVAPTRAIQHEADARIPLAERVRAEHGPGPHPVSATGSGDGATPPITLPPEDMEALVRDWAMQMFKEKMMFGEEEETGVTPLSIDI